MAYLGAGHSGGVERDHPGERDQPSPGRTLTGQGTGRGGPADLRPPSTCCAGQRGWAGAHRHLGVRPSSRVVRRERPPHRWC
ncbi:hypothetical protein [Micromonospora sp. LOL_021]|uniref:hypothetical protein n=1 Tax=Micromonospora sp. LOL_021 TaxID=3345417 RepID=UPI003A84FBB8